MERGKESFLWSYEYDRLCRYITTTERERESYALSEPQERYIEREQWLSHIFNLLRIFSYELCAKVVLFGFYISSSENESKMHWIWIFRYLIVTGLEWADVNLKCSECSNSNHLFWVSRRAKQRYKRRQ